MKDGSRNAIVFTSHIQGNFEMGQLYIVQHTGKNSGGQHIYLFQRSVGSYFFISSKDLRKNKCVFSPMLFYFLNSF